MMFQYKCLNPISPCGTSLFTEEYKQVEELQKADAVLVRSAAMHDMQDVPNLLAVARAGAGVNNIPITILDAGGSSIRRDHYLVTAIYFTISVYITVFYVSRFNSTTKILCRAIIDFFLTAE